MDARRAGLRKQLPLVTTIVSFGFKHGVPMDADLVFDVRFLPNPHFVPELKPKTGRDGDRPVHAAHQGDARVRCGAC